MSRTDWGLNLNAILILIISGVLLSAFFVQFVEHEKPCPLCLLQRVGMIGVAFGAVLNIIYGIRTSHYGFSLLSCLVGGSVALRQISLHVCPGFPTFGVPVLGLSLYTWSFVVFVCSVLYIAILLFLYQPNPAPAKKEPFTVLALIAFCLILLITLMNTATALMQCGFGPCAE